MKTISVLPLLVSATLLTICGCSGVSTVTPGAGGGSTGIGGGPGTGGSSNAGGSGGATSAVAGSSGTGGVVGAGGNAPTGGAIATGGAVTATGGAATGGTPNMGGSRATGGASSTGGSKSNTGGTRATGGAPSTGGSKAAGGTATTGGASSAGASSTDPLATYRQLCVSTINSFRATKGLAALTEWTSAETCVDGQSTADQTSNTAHSAFGNCNENAQDECITTNSTSQLVACLTSMWNEKNNAACTGCDACSGAPSTTCPNCTYSTCGHYVNMSAQFYTEVACGFSSLGGWSTQDFK